MGIARQIHNFRESRKENGKWSSPAPLIATVAFLTAWNLAPTSLPSWGLLFLLLDVDTLVFLVMVPKAFLAKDNN